MSEKLDPIAKLACIGGIAAWVTHALTRWIINSPLGHDEAEYALDATDLLAGEASRWIYISSGMQGIAMPGVLAGGDERVLRLLPMLIGIGFLLAAWYVARRLFSATTAAWTVAVLAGAPQMLRWSAALLADMPSSACLLLGLAVIFSELARSDGPRRRLVLAAPLLAAAFYVRYASCVPIALIGIAAIVCFARPIVKSPRLPLLTAGLLVVLLVPHFINAIRLTGWPLGIILTSGNAAPAGTGIGEYFTKPLANYGLIVAPLAVIGALAIKRDRISTAIQAIAIAQIVTLSLVTIAQPRYIFFATVLLVIRGVDTVRTLAPHLGRARRAAAALVLAALAAVWITSLAKLVRYGPGNTPKMAAVLVTASAIRRDANGAPCEFLGRHQTQVEWYSGCRGTLVVPHEAIAAGKHVYAVWDLSGGMFQQNLAAMPGTIVLHLPGFAGVERMSP